MRGVRERERDAHTHTHIHTHTHTHTNASITDNKSLGTVLHVDPVIAMVPQTLDAQVLIPV